MTDKIIQLSQIIKTYTIAGMQSQVLKGVSLQVARGEFLAIVGSSGSGKSTLMNIIGLLDRADSGEYWFNGQNMASLGPDQMAELRNQHIGFVFQQFNLLSRFTVIQNVALPLSYRKISAPEIESRVQAALLQVGMQAFGKHRPTQLSGGQQQRVAIARALVTDPTILLADEPTGSLDSKTGAQVLQLFLNLHAQGRTIIMITHDEKIAAQSKRQISVSDGLIINSGSQACV